MIWLLAAYGVSWAWFSYVYTWRASMQGGFNIPDMIFAMVFALGWPIIEFMRWGNDRD